jgi:hypothetical protein
MGKFIGKLSSNLGFNKIFDKDEELAKIITDNEVFFDLEYNFEDAVDFKENPEYKLDHNQYFYVDYSQYNSDVIDTITEYYTKINSTGEITTLAKENLSKIEFLIYGKNIEGNSKLNFQVITPKYFIKSKSYLKFKTIELGDEIEYKHEKDILEFKDEISIHINEDTTKIYFKYFSDLKKIHKKFIELYIEASKEEKEEFINAINDYIMFSLDDSKLKLQPSNLKKLKYILDNNMLESVFKHDKKVEKYIKRYQKSLKLKKVNDKYIVKDNRDFTSLMKVIYENYYKGEITGKKLESNSSKILETK